MARFITLTTEVKSVKHSWFEVDFPTRSCTFNSNSAAEDQNCFRPNASQPSWLQIVLFIAFEVCQNNKHIVSMVQNYTVKP